MRIYALSDIHGCLTALNEALARFEDELERPDTKLVFLGDYMHGGEDNRGVMDRIMALQRRYGPHRVIALLGNHDAWVVAGTCTIDRLRVDRSESGYDTRDGDERYVDWLSSLPRVHAEGNTIFVHAGIDEELAASGLWEWTDEETYIYKFPPATGIIDGFDQKIVAGHVSTAEVARNRQWRDIYYDGGSHYYIDGSVLLTGQLNVLMVDTDTDKYYRVTDNGIWLILPYDEEG